MDTILALQGKSESGKSHCIRLLYDRIVLMEGVIVIQTNINSGYKDFFAIISYNGKIIGITSAGDSYSILEKKLELFEKENCNIIVCACRSFDKGNHGTNSALRKFHNYKLEYIGKTFTDNSNNYFSVNQKDADRLLVEIQKLL